MLQKVDFNHTPKKLHTWEELQAYETSKGTIRFPVDKPLPAALVRKIVKARIAQNERKQKR